MNRNIVWLIAILFVAGAMLIWRPFAPAGGDAGDDGYRAIQPDFTAQGLVLRVYAEDGQLTHKISADEMTHFSPIKLTELEQPVYVVTTSDRLSSWEVIAEAGSFYDDKNLVLERGVRISKLDTSDFMERAETSYLVIDTTLETMETDQPVTLYGRDFVVRGEGLQADLRAQTLELTKHVQTIYTGNTTPRN
ncbi:LPS export ABC transporter periplasmic protein LptC [Pseudidiomarina mangrovi]|uniref:LPS export ABC transporter periplasmic protein LptC n=1 Tax=Pseudidiomarina mangrovi TaxID=2487133 RepID=UPI000FCC3F96|nr:LPS export ABC transporter periplasmic protein LptC [Pseudidiomarina mangrovi]CAI8165610.1 MAG: Lipopolysaccharide export system protein LptC [Pseudidiomarina mangrovi]